MHGTASAPLTGNNRLRYLDVPRPPERLESIAARRDAPPPPLPHGAAAGGHRPSIDVLFRSAAAALESAVVGVLMIGMGRAGVEDGKAILDAGGLTIGRDGANPGVYSTNKAAFVEGAVEARFALDELPADIRDVAGFRAGLGGATASG